jgi:N-acyl-D-amino-acid deacylase
MKMAKPAPFREIAHETLALRAKQVSPCHLAQLQLRQLFTENPSASITKNFSAFPLNFGPFPSTPMLRFLSLALLALLAATAPAADGFSVTGMPQPELTSFDAWMQSFMTEHQIPGGALAIVKDGRLVYARGFGWADRDATEPVQAESLFRIASVSKPITAVAILKLVEAGKLKVEDKVLDHLHYEPHLEEGGTFDERWRQVTIAHCLSHAGGWDRAVSYDPMFQAIRMSKSMKIELPILPEHIIRYQLGQPLDFDPGERYAYSNFGYSLLGRIIEKVTGQPYEKYVQDDVLKPLGITRAMIGGSLESQRVSGEVRYYDVKNGTGIATVGEGAGDKRVPISYGVWRQETLDSHGGWIASAPDLARFAAAFDLQGGENKTRGGLLQPATVKLMFGQHVGMPSADDKTKFVAHYGYGWMIKEEPAADGQMQLVARHGGALACTAASLMHFPDGTNLAVLFNLGQSPDGKFFGRQIEGPLTELVRGVKKWPNLQ